MVWTKIRTSKIKTRQEWWEEKWSNLTLLVNKVYYIMIIMSFVEMMVGTAQNIKLFVAAALLFN